jgi:predicted membrane protein
MNFDKLPRGGYFALMLIISGAFLFLDNIGVLPVQNIGAYWPIWIIIWGLFMFDRVRSPVAGVWTLAVVVWGTLLILGNLHILTVHGGVFWPVMIIALGITLLMRPNYFHDWPERMREHQMRMRSRQSTQSQWQPRFQAQSFMGNKLRESVVFGSLSRRVETQQFEGGKIESVFGSIEIDLSNAAISCPERQVRLDATAVFGGIEIRVPNTWKVIMKGTAVFGGCNDRTIPPRPEPGLAPVTLVVKGEAVFGGLEIRN